MAAQKFWLRKMKRKSGEFFSSFFIEFQWNRTNFSFVRLPFRFFFLILLVFFTICLRHSSVWIHYCVCAIFCSPLKEWNEVHFHCSSLFSIEKIDENICTMDLNNVDNIGIFLFYLWNWLQGTRIFPEHDWNIGILDSTNTHSGVKMSKKLKMSGTSENKSYVTWPDCRFNLILK